MHAELIEKYQKERSHDEKLLERLFSSEQGYYLKKKARETGLTLLETIISSSLITQHELYQAIASITGASYSQNFPSHCHPLLRPKDWREALVSQIIPLQNERGELRFWHCPQGRDLTRFIENCARDPQFSSSFILSPPQNFRLFLRRFALFEWKTMAISSLKRHAPRFSANCAKSQKTFAFVFSLFIMTVVIGSFISPVFALIAGSLFGVVFFALLMLRFIFGFIPPVNPPQKPLLTAELPFYTVILALYHEAEMIKPLLEALEKIDYPRAKLDVKLVLEADDQATFMALKNSYTALHLDVIIAPPDGPRTKPKALMLALPFSRGELLCVYDAEDRPHPQQLREAAQVFTAGSSKLAVLQAPLILRNAHKNMLTRFFSADYASLFDVILPTLARFNLPLPLGGTSNHFKLQALRKIGGWDPYNVTEDADLGLRLARFGYEAGVITSATSEIAPETYDIWLKQRTRWFKGWLQTMLVHFSRPRDLLRDMGFVKSIAIFLLLGGSFLSALLHPIGVIAAVFYGSPFAIGFMVFGYIIGGMALFMGSKRYKRHSCGLYLLLLPVWWVILSIAAWRAVKELYLRPFHWAKTPHDL